MGCGKSKQVKVRGVPAQAYYMKVVRPEVEEFLDLIDFSDADAGALFEVFTTIDEDLNHDVSLKEFYKHYKIKKSMFADRVFGILDRDGSGELSFKEFMIGIWNFCTLDSKNMVRFAFELYDFKGSGYLSMGQCSSLLRMMYNLKQLTPRLKKILANADSDGDGKFSLEEWHQMSTRHPELMKPALEAQRIVMKKTFGKRFWAKKTKFRVKQYELQNVFRIIETHEREREAETKQTAEEEAAARAKREADERDAAEAKAEADEAERLRIWNKISQVERDEINGKKECDRLKQAADEIYAVAPYKDRLNRALEDPVLCCALAALEKRLQETIPLIDQAFEIRLKREIEEVTLQTRIEVEDFYSTKKGRRMLKVQVADKKKNSHMFTKKQMKKAYVQQEYLDVKTENRVRETRERLTRDFKRDLDKYEDMLDQILLDYEVDDSEVNEDVWERHFDYERQQFFWHCPVTAVTLYTIPVKGQEDPDYDALHPFRMYHKDDIYARIATGDPDTATVASSYA